MSTLVFVRSNTPSFFICLLSLLFSCTSPEAKTEAESGEAEPVQTLSMPASDLAKVLQFAEMGNMKLLQNGEAIDLIPTLLTVCDELTAANIAYSATEGTDASGMVHKVLQELKAAFPDMEVPSFELHRETRGLAKWYHENGQLLAIPSDSVASPQYQAMIKPGMVMFFGEQALQVPASIEVDSLLVKGKGIANIGVVVKVDYDSDGQIERYHMFHGRNPKNPAGITNYHTRVPTRDGYPALGNGSQPWVAIAPIAVGMYE